MSEPSGSAGIVFFNRYTGREERERVYGQAWLRWAYGALSGRLALQLVARRPFFSRWYGWRMDRPASRAKVLPFIREFGLDTSEFAEAPETYRTFNEFFFRKLKSGSRPVDPDPAAIVFPADGRHLGFARLDAAEGFFAKGQRFDLTSFLRDDRLVRRYSGGSAVFSRLCPVDYHRFHFPVDGVPGTPRRIDGWLWSVNPLALRGNLAFLWENRRWLCEIESPGAGRVLMAEIGATNVGSLEYTFAPGVHTAKGAEKGFFRFGGSAVLLLFEPGRVRLSDDLRRKSAAQQELYSHMGDRLGTVQSG